MRTFRITVDGTPYDVSVEELDSPAGAAPVPHPVAAPVAAPVQRPAASAPPPPSAAPVSGGPGDVISPLAGTVVKVEVSVGQQVAQGQPVVVLEAMKMNTNVTASRGGTVNAINITAGSSVSEGQILLSIG